MIQIIGCFHAPRNAPFRVMTTNQHPALIDTKAAAQFLGIGKRTVQVLVTDRKLACIKIGRAVRFDPADLRAFVEANRVKAEGWKGRTAK
jgi:excisionase family DNA binding protein